MSPICDCCGLGGRYQDVRHVRVIARDPRNPVDRLALCRGCLTRKDRSWRRRWRPAVA